MAGARPLGFVDLFSGAGGWTEGLKRAGLLHLVGVELDSGCAASYEANHGAGSVLVADVARVKPAHLAPFLRGRTVDILVASPPCQSFSPLAAKRYTTRDPSDRLYLHVVRLAHLMRPEWVIVENVVGFARKRTSGPRSAADDLIRRLRGIGFGTVEARVLRAEEHGVPQLRRRLLVIARRAGPVAFPAPLAGFDASLQRLLLPASRVPPFYWLTPTKTEYYRLRSEAMPGRVRFVDPARPSLTVRAGYYKSHGAEALVKQAGRVRMLTESELAAIQSFPPGYRFLGAHGAICKQVGNAVPPALARHVGRALLRAAAGGRPLPARLGLRPPRDAPVHAGR